MSEIFYEQQLYDAAGEAPPWCDWCGGQHFGDCDNDR